MPRKPVDEVLASLNILRIISNSSEFRSWFKSTHKTSESQIEKKVEVIKKEYQGYNIVPTLAVYSQVPAKVKRRLIERNINVVKNLKADTSKLFSRTETSIVSRVLEYR